MSGKVSQPRRNILRYIISVWDIYYIFKQHSLELDGGTWSRQEHELGDTNRRHCQHNLTGGRGRGCRRSETALLHSEICVKEPSSRTFRGSVATRLTVRAARRTKREITHLRILRCIRKHRIPKTAFTQGVKLQSGLKYLRFPSWFNLINRHKNRAFRKKICRCLWTRSLTTNKYIINWVFLQLEAKY